MIAPGARHRPYSPNIAASGSDRRPGPIKHHIMGSCPWDHQYFVYTIEASGRLSVNRWKSCFFIDKFHD